MSKFTLPVLLITTSLGIGAAYSALGDGAPLSNLDSGISSNFSMNVRTVAADALEPGSSALTLVENNQSGIHNTTHTAVDEYGNIFGFRFDGIYNNGDIEIVDPNTGEVTGYRPGYEIQNLQLCGVTAINAKTATIPDSVAISYEWYVVKAPVTDAQLYYPLSGDSSFPASSLTDIIFPTTIRNVSINTEGTVNVRKYHFRSEEVPYFNFYNGAGTKINIYVPNELVQTYRAALESENSVVRSETPATPVKVNVATPGTLAETISTLIEDLEDVRWLIVTGTPDEQDLRLFRRMPYLETLDLSRATGFKAMYGCNGLRYLTDVILPDGLEEIGNNAFEECTNLTNIVMPESITKIGNHSLEKTAIEEINLANIKAIGEYAFNECKNLKSVDFSNLTSLGEYAFSNCLKLKSIDLSHFSSYITRYAFSYCNNLTEVTFGDQISSIEDGAFQECNLKEVNLPSSLSYLGWCTFGFNYNLKKIIINSNNTYNIQFNIGAFNGTSPDTIIYDIIFPPENSGFDDGCDLSNCTMFVPALTLNEYLLNDVFAKFKKIDAIDEEISDLNIEFRDYTLKNDKWIADKANIYLGMGTLTVNRKTDLNLGKFRQLLHWAANWDWNNPDRTDFYGSTLLTESKMTAEDIEINITLPKDRWHFLTFPFDINVKDIAVNEDALWVVRKYSGQDRAALNENTWQNMTDNDVLKAGEGYIFHSTKEDGDQINFTFRPAADGNNLFAMDAKEKSLASYPSEFAHNASWNLVGNTYPAYLNIKGIDFDAPITVWDRDTYYAYSPLDDEFVLEPFQAFFVQCQETEGGNLLTLSPNARAHSRESALALDLQPTRAPRMEASERSIFNLSVKGENGADRTRIVVNDEASAAYEMNRDAAKFMSSVSEVPQIFVMNNGNRMAIDEQPLGDGVFTLGTRFGASGSYTISLVTRNADDYTVTLIDNATGTTADITKSDYSFSAEEGLDNNRFLIRIEHVKSGVESIGSENVAISMNGNMLNISAPEEIEISVVSINGKTIVSKRADSFAGELENGIYVVKAGNVTTKVISGK